MFRALSAFLASFGVLGFLTVVALWVGMAIGWIWNIVKLFGHGFGGFDPEFVVRLVGVFLAPIGGIVGWM